MIRTLKASFFAFLALFITICVQLQHMDTESYLNADIYQNYDYDRNGETGDAQTVEHIFKVPALVLQALQPIVISIFTFSYIPSVHIFKSNMRLADYQSLPFRPPAHS